MEKKIIVRGYKTLNINKVGVYMKLGDKWTCLLFENVDAITLKKVEKLIRKAV